MTTGQTLSKHECVSTHRCLQEARQRILTRGTSPVLRIIVQMMHRIPIRTPPRSRQATLTRAIIGISVSFMIKSGAVGR